MMVMNTWKSLLCARVGHFGAKQERRMGGAITCKRCYRVVGYWNDSA